MSFFSTIDKLKNRFQRDLEGVKAVAKECGFKKMRCIPPGLWVAERIGDVEPIRCTSAEALIAAMKENRT